MIRICYLLAVVLIAGCDTTYRGFDSLSNGWYSRLDRLGDCEGSGGEADFSLISFQLRGARSDREAGPWRIYSGNLKHVRNGDSGLQLADLIAQMECGEGITLGLSWDAVLRQWIGAYIDSTLFERHDGVFLSLRLERVFTTDSWKHYLQAAAQQGELEEAEAIELSLIDESYPVERHGKLYLVRERESEGDSIFAGREVHIRYTTGLLNGQRLDSLTEMVFPFGKPGQLIPGLQYGLSFLREGERARVLMPSFLAFGEGGSSTGIVPRNTPVQFDVEVVRVGSD